MPIIADPIERVVSTGAAISTPPVSEVTIPTIDSCQVLTRMKTFVTKLGIVPTLEHTLRDKTGQPLDISEFFPGGGNDTGKLYLRSKEIISPATGCNTVKQVTGTCLDPVTGLVSFTMTNDMVPRAGIYQLSICLADGNFNSLHIENPIMWVERSLFTLDSGDTTFNLGPPSIEEVRQAIMDNGAEENLLLDNVEFSDDQIAFAVTRPIRRWNDTPPPLRPLMNTQTFPFPDPWLDAICGHLFIIAANNYRRNRLPYSAGGISVDDKSKEPEYMKAGQELLQKYDAFVQYKKVEINTALFTGNIGSQYGGLFH